MKNTIESAIENSKKLAKDYLKGFERLNPFKYSASDCGEYLDPWVWHIFKDPNAKHKPDPNRAKYIFILQDWYAEKTGNNEETNREWIDWVYNPSSSKTKPRDEHGKEDRDMTMEKLESNLGKKECGIIEESIIFNAVWALRAGDNPNGYLGEPIHRHAFLVWFNFLAALVTIYGPKAVFFCGTWAKSELPANSLVDYIKNIWITFFNNERALRKEPLPRNIDLDIMLGMWKTNPKVFCLRHPCVWRKSDKECIYKTINSA